MVRKIIVVPLAVMLGAATIGLAYPLLTGLPGSEQNVIPRFASQWYVGKGAETKPTLQYDVKTAEMDFTVMMKFLEQAGDEQQVQLIIDDSAGHHFDETLTIGKAYVFIDVPERIKPYVYTLDKTVLSVRDTVVEPKYLVVGAEWGTTYIGKFTPKMKVTDYQDVTFEFGQLKAYKISYKVNDVENYFLVADNVPLPLRSEYRNLDGVLEYSYELTGFEPS
ncbi:MAG TPA: hypothetical protein VNK44_08320 [Candidatus Nitrosotenuis sp.]|nr:hypothetical protein [Candidatus Nitrosotenuis sp.]